MRKTIPLGKKVTFLFWGNSLYDLSQILWKLIWQGYLGYNKRQSLTIKYNQPSSKQLQNSLRISTPPALLRDHQTRKPVDYRGAVLHYTSAYIRALSNERVRMKQEEEGKREKRKEIILKFKRQSVSFYHAFSLFVCLFAVFSWKEQSFNEEHCIELVDSTENPSTSSNIPGRY